MSTDIPLSDYIAIGNVGFEWANSYDVKDWERLRKTLGPSVTLDFRGLAGVGLLHENLSPDEYVALLSSPALLGNNKLKTQHLLGRSSWELLADGRVHVSYQARVAHQRYKDDDLTVVANKGHGHGVVQHWYRKIEGSWKLEISASTSEWSEFDIWGTLSGKDSDRPL